MLALRYLATLLHLHILYSVEYTKLFSTSQLCSWKWRRKPKRRKSISYSL